MARKGDRLCGMGRDLFISCSLMLSTISIKSLFLSQIPFYFRRADATARVVNATLVPVSPGWFGLNWTNVYSFKRRHDIIAKDL